MYNFMIYQIMGMSGMYGVCTGVCGCVQVCGGVRWCAIVFTGVPRCFWVCAWGCDCGRVYMGMLCPQVCVCVFRYVYASMHGLARVSVSVCGMNFQNTFWRLES